MNHLVFASLLYKKLLHQNFANLNLITALKNSANLQKNYVALDKFY
jgi:hypothetical protein